MGSAMQPRSNCDGMFLRSRLGMQINAQRADGLRIVSIPGLRPRGYR
jgi:hypothetical protein